MATFREKLELLIDANVAGFIAAMDKAGAAADKNLGKETTGKLDQLAGKFTVMGAAAVGGAAVAAAGLGKLAAVAGEAQVAQAKLDNSIANSSQKFSDNGAAVSDLASELQKKVAADDESIRSGQSVLIQFGLTEDQVLRLTPLIVDLSRKMGIDLDTAAKQVGKSATGSQGALKKLGIDVKDLGEGSTDAEKTISALNKTVGGFAQAEGKTFSGQLEILKNQLSELGESVGQGAAGTLQSIVGSANDLLSSLNDVNPGISAAVGSFATLGTIGLGAAGALSFGAGQVLTFRENLAGLTAGLRTAEGGLTRFGRAAAIGGGVVIGAAIVAGVVEIGNQFNKATQNAKQFEDAVRVLGGAAQGDSFAAFADAVNANVGTLDRASQKVDSLTKQIGPLGVALGSALLGPAGALTSSFATLNSILGNNSDLMLKISTQSQTTTLDLNALGETVDKVNESGNLAALQATYDQLVKLSNAPIGGENSQEVKQAITQQRDRAKEFLDQALNATAAQRNVDVATKQAATSARDQALASGQTADGLQQVSATAADLKDISDELTLSQKQLTASFDGNQAAAKGFAGALAFVTNNASASIDAAQQVGKSINDAFRDSKDAKGDVVPAAIKALPAEFDAATAALGGYSEQQNKAIDALQAYGSAAQNQLQVLISQGASNEEITRQAQGYADLVRNTLIPQFEAQGLSLADATAKAEGYVAQLGLTKPQIETQIKLSGIEEAKQQLQFLQGDFDNLPKEKRAEIYAAVQRGEWDQALKIYNDFKDKQVNIDLQVQYNAQGVTAEATAARQGRVAGKRAGGGSVMKDKTYLVGEKGPELFTPDVSGGITPNDTLRTIVNTSTSSASSQSYESTTFAPTFNINGSDPTTTASESVRKLRDLAFLGA